MDELTAQLRPVYKTAWWVLAACAAWWAVWPDHRPIAAGLFVGIAVSLANSWFLSYKIRRLAEAAASRRANRINLGFLTRAAMAVLVVGLAVKSPGDLNWIAALAGLFYTQLALLVTGILPSSHKR